MIAAQTLRVCREGKPLRVFEGLREELANPEAIAEYVRTYNAERRRWVALSPLWDSLH
jgi:hypothetical protein